MTDSLSNEGVRLEYGWPSTALFNQNFNSLQTTSPEVYSWLNWFVRTSTLAMNVAISLHGWDYPCDPHNDLALTHSHAVSAKFPAISPQAPKYIHFSDSNNASMNYPWRYSSALLNISNSKTEAYSHTWIDANWTVTLLAKAWLDESSCVADSYYTDISPQSGFSFWVNKIRWLRPDQVEIYS
jgi:hypothetical protein